MLVRIEACFVICLGFSCQGLVTYVYMWLAFIQSYRTISLSLITMEMITMEMITMEMITMAVIIVYTL